jgi:hypothetical protein
MVYIYSVYGTGWAPFVESLPLHRAFVGAGYRMDAAGFLAGVKRGILTFLGATPAPP